MSTEAIRLTDETLKFRDHDDVRKRIEGHLRHRYSRRLFVQNVENTIDGYIIQVGIAYPRDVSDCRDRDNVLKMVNIGEVETLSAYPIEGDYYEIELPDRSDLYASFKDRRNEILAQLDTTMARTIYERVYSLNPVYNQLAPLLEIVDYVREDSPLPIDEIEAGQNTSNTRKYITALADHDFLRVDDEIVTHGPKIEAADIDGKTAREYEKWVIGYIIDEAYYTLRFKLDLGMLNYLPKFANAYYISALRRGKDDLWLSLEDIQENLRAEYRDNVDTKRIRRRVRSLDRGKVLKYEDGAVSGRRGIFQEMETEFLEIG